MFDDEQTRFIQSTLQALQPDVSGLIRVTISPLSSEPKKKTRRFSNRETHIDSTPHDDEIRTITRDIALMSDELAAFERIDGLPVEILNRAAAVFGFKAENLKGLKTEFAHVVGDIRQMENIAAARPAVEKPIDQQPQKLIPSDGNQEQKLPPTS